MGRGRSAPAAVLLSLLLSTGCSGPPAPPRDVEHGGAAGRQGAADEAPNEQAEEHRELIRAYFAGLNSAGLAGREAQRDFFERTGHPGQGTPCDLGELTISIEPTLSTLRTDPHWQPAGGQSPDGVSYVVAVSAVWRQGGSTVSNQISGQHLVVSDDTVYGFAPCPR
ncbi:MULTISPECIES: hypothetical protein [Actinoalloteichus]|uniref:Lipoprotein n=1 Tax=Actinoalloteichus fjordicus TaxID=1612552 RepID=A0AAC9LJ57_9PSEU|nr:MULTISPECIES: hypothetical protein [Actinoalloteichus]APU17805.1 hypothetical protein UA74_29065 [Actinoalloteichus fjordicus]APU23883.1 hypothetical protein UA75_29595 [Actinoalloteichus sp. GBA129-24]